MVLIEAMVALSILTLLGLVLLKLSMNILHPRQWILSQTISDAYLTYERALAERIPFENLVEDLVAPKSPWPAFPTTSTVENVEIGRLSNNRPITGTVVRTRFSDIDGKFPDEDMANFEAEERKSVLLHTPLDKRNPSAMKVWKVQSVLIYTIGSRTYAKSRTVIRSQ